MTGQKENSIKAQTRTRWFDARFAAFAGQISRRAGAPLTFLMAAVLILAWAIAGRFAGYSAAWVNVLHIVIGISTFLMVLILQNSQNRDGLAVQIKLDEIIRAVQDAENSIINLEELSQQELEEERAKFAELGKEARKSGSPDS